MENTERRSDDLRPLEDHMSRLQMIVGMMALVGVLASTSVAQNPPSSPAFKAVHLANLTDDEASKLLAWITDMNEMIAKAGYPNVRYRLYKVAGKQNGSYGYMWESTWPSEDVYAKAHADPGWDAVDKKHKSIASMVKDQTYDRYVEVMPTKR
jgi:hypothetical protein